MEQLDLFGWAEILRGASDAEVRGPLWGFPPEARNAVLHERRRRFQIDDEPIGDPEYS